MASTFSTRMMEALLPLPTHPSTLTPLTAPTPQTQQRPLPISAGLGIKAGGGDGVHLVDKDDGGRVLLGQPEHVPHHAGALQTHGSSECVKKQ